MAKNGATRRDIHKLTRISSHAQTRIRTNLREGTVEMCRMRHWRRQRRSRCMAMALQRGAYSTASASGLLRIVAPQHQSRPLDLRIAVASLSWASRPPACERHGCGRRGRVKDVRGCGGRDESSALIQILRLVFLLCAHISLLNQLSRAVYLCYHFIGAIMIEYGSETASSIVRRFFP